MSTTKPILGLAVLVLMTTVAAPAVADMSTTNPLHPAYYANKVNMPMAFGDKSTSVATDTNRSNPLHPIYYANKFSGNPWLATNIGSRTWVTEILNPLHPQYKR